MASIAKITVEEIPAMKAKRAAIIDSMPPFESANSRKPRHNLRRDAKRIEKQIYRARRAAREV